MMILITGCNALGTGLVNAMSGEIVKGACDHTNPEIPRGFITYDAMNADSISRLLDEQRPQALMLTEEVENLEYCEKHRVDAMEFNTRSVRFFTEAAKKIGARVVYRSTPFVFDGRKPGGLYTETDRVNPINVYGETKLMGEVHTDKVPDFLIVRVGELYGSYPENFASNVYDSIKYGQKIELASDMYSSPIYLDDAVFAIKELTTKRMSGFYNIAGPERISHYEFGRRIAKAFGLSEDLIVPISAKEMGFTVLMPGDTSLDIAKLSALIKIRDIEKGLSAMKAATANKK